MNEDENDAIEAMCLLSAENLSALPPNAFEIPAPSAQTKSKKPRKNYYIKKKFREDLPDFPMKAPRNFTIMPTADPRTDYPRLVIETLVTDEEKFETLMKRIGAPDMLAIFQHHGSEDNPLGPNYREVLGVQNFIDFYLAVMHGAPDVITTIIKDSVKCSVDRDTNEAFIVFKLMCFGTQLMFVQEKEPGEEERELAEIMSHIDNNVDSSIEKGINSAENNNSSSTTNNDPNNEELLPPNKKQARKNNNNSNNTSTSNTGISVKDTKHVYQILKSKSYTFSKYNTSGSYRDCIVGPTTKVIKLSRGNLHTNNNANNNINNSNINNTNTNTTDMTINNNNINKNLTTNSVHTSTVYGNRDTDNNSEISSTFSDKPQHNRHISPNHSPTHSSTHGSTYGSTHGSTHHSSTHLSADHSSTHSSTHSVTHSETHTTAATGDCSIDSLVSSFNSFKLEPITNRPIVSTYHYGTYVIVTDGNHKITRWYNFFKQTVGQAPAFPGMGTGVRDDICLGGGMGSGVK